MTPTLVALRALGLGDLLTAVPALRALARAFPDHRRVLAAPRTLKPLARLTGAVDDVVETRALAPLAPELWASELAVNFHGRGPQSHRVLLASQPRRLIAFENHEIPETARFPEWRADEHEVERWCRLLRETGIPADASDLDLDVPPAPRTDVAVGATVIHPGAASPARRWPPERFAAVARAERERGRTVVVTGTAAEVDLARAVAEAAGLERSAVYAGKTNVHELACLVARAGRVVCGDTGVAHLATAFRTPSVILFGPVSPTHWGPPPERPWHRVLWRGRTGDPHAGSPDEGLLEITVDDVLEELDFLGRPLEFVA